MSHLITRRFFIITNTFYDVENIHACKNDVYFYLMFVYSLMMLENLLFLFLQDIWKMMIQTHDEVILNFNGNFTCSALVKDLFSPFSQMIKKKKSKFVDKSFNSKSISIKKNQSLQKIVYVY